MPTFEHAIDVNVPVSDCYNQWTQFEMFPYFREGIKEVKQLTSDRLRWRAEIAGKEEEWDAVITEQMPDQRIAWTSTSGAKNAGVVTFHHIDDTTSRVMLQITYEPSGIVEGIGAALGLVEARVKGDLDRFKAFIEAGGKPTGGWRGTIDHHD